jgi:hypothetical protein
MSGGDEWGPWIEHGGNRIPTEFAVGDVVQLISENNETGDLETSLPKVVEARDFVRYNWFWGESTHDTLRYRIRKPRALLDMIALVETLQAPVKVGVDAL